MYCLIGCCEPKADHTEIADKLDDYLWLKLSQLSFDDSHDDNQEKLTLTQLQTMMLEEYGRCSCKFNMTLYLFQVCV